MATTTITVDKVMENVRAEEDERSRVTDLLSMAEAYVTNYINRDVEKIAFSDEEQRHFDLAVMFAASDFYSNSTGGGRNNASTKSTGLNVILDGLREPALGDRNVTAGG